MTGMRTRTLVVLGVLLCSACTSQHSDPVSAEQDNEVSTKNREPRPSSREVSSVPQTSPRQPPFFDAPNPVMTVPHLRGTPLKVETAVTCAEPDAQQPWLTEATVDTDAYGPLEVQLVPIDPPSPYPGLAAVRRTYQVSVTAEPGALKADRFEVRLMSGRQSDPERILAFHIDARRPVEVLPEIVRFTASAGQELAPRIAILRFAEEDAWSCEVVESPDWLTVTPKPREAETVSRLVLDLAPGTAAGKGAEGTVVLKVSAPGRTEMTCQLHVQRP